MFVKKENLQKDVQIRKLATENKKKNWCVMKKNDELKRVKKVNETLKKLLKPMRKKRTSQKSIQTE